MTVPPLKTGWEDEYQGRIAKFQKGLGWFVGFIIFSLTATLLAIELLMNPIFLFAQAEANHVQLGGVFSLATLALVLVTFATTGVQYALFQEGQDKKSIGYKLGWVIAALDTFMDGGGFTAWLNGFVKADGFWEGLFQTGDSTGMLWSTFPPLDKEHAYWWMAEIFICSLCLLHERFLGRMLGRVRFEPGMGAGDGVINIYKWVYRAGKLYNMVKLIALAFAPYVMMGLDILLFSLSARGEAGPLQWLWLIFSMFITAAGMMIWESYNHLRKEGYKLKDLDRTFKFTFYGALAVTLFDSVLDLIGFNKIIFGSAWPSDVGMTLPFILTAGLVMLLCTTFEALNSDLFLPLASFAHSVVGMPDDGFDDDGMGDPGGGGDLDEFGM